jgi:hypothetical protein
MCWKKAASNGKPKAKTPTRSSSRFSLNFEGAHLQ